MALVLTKDFGSTSAIKSAIAKQSDRLKKTIGLWKATTFDRTCIRAETDLTMLKRAHLTVTSHLEELSAVQQWFQALISRLAIDTPWVDEQFDQLNLALAEGFTNAVRHAHANLPGSTPIDIELLLQPEKIEICIFDQGDPFDPNSLNEPQPGSLREGGYGWFLLRRLADQVTYDRAVPQDPSPGPLPISTESSEIPRNCLRIVKTSKIV